MKTESTGCFLTIFRQLFKLYTTTDTDKTRSRSIREINLGGWEFFWFLHLSTGIQRCKQFVYQNLASHITVQDVADALGLNVTYLSGLFRENEGMTLKQYILAEKVRAAQDMLTFSDAPIEEIADRLCFSSCGHFSATFKKQIGQTPTVYRNLTRSVTI